MFEVQAGPLAAALALTNLALEPRVKADAAHIAAIEGEGIQLTTNAPDRMITAICPAVITGPGEIAVRAAALAGIAANLPADAVVSVETTGAVVAVSSGVARYRLPTIPIRDLPTMLRGGSEAAHVELDRDSAVRAFTIPVSACATEVTRYYLSGVYITSDGATLVAVATDGRRLVKLDVPAAGALFAGVIVPLPAAKIIGKLVQKTKINKVSLRVSKTLFELATPGFTFVTRLIDGQYPDYARVIPRPSDNTAIVDRRAFVSALERMTAAADPSGDFAPAARIEWDGNGFRLSLLDQPGAATDAIAAQTTGTGSVAAKLSYIADIAAELVGPAVQLDSASRTAPIRIASPDDPSVLALLMPILGRNSAARPGAPSRSQPRHETSDAHPLPGAAGHT